MNIQVAPVFLERLMMMESDLLAANHYFETASKIYIAALEKVKLEDKEIWNDLAREYNLSPLVKYEITRSGILQEKEAEKEES